MVITNFDKLTLASFGYDLARNRDAPYFGEPSQIRLT
jgi:hypothetical protein